MNYTGLSAFLSHFFIITIPHFIRQILRKKHWIPDKKYFVDPCLRHISSINKAFHCIYILNISIKFLVIITFSFFRALYFRNIIPYANYQALTEDDYSY